MVHADIKQLLFIGELGLLPNDLGYGHTTRLAESDRIDIETGLTAIEVRPDLRARGAVKSAEHQLSNYITDRGIQTGERYAGIVTDGAQWRLYQHVNCEMHQIASLKIEPTDANVNRLLVWLESILATGKNINPNPREIVGRLGANSPGHALDAVELAGLYAKYSEQPNVKLKRDMWARLL